MMDKEQRQQQLIDRLWKEIQEWKQIACDKNVRIQALEDESEERRKALESMTARYDELKRELRMSDMAFESVDRERITLEYELKALKEQLKEQQEHGND